MDTGQLAVICLFGVPVIGGLVTGLVKIVLDANERRFAIQVKAQQSASATQNSQIEALRAELASLRDTCTQFDLSLDKTQQGMQDRLTRLEQKLAPPRPTVVADEPRQIVGRSE